MDLYSFLAIAILLVFALTIAILSQNKRALSKTLDSKKDKPKPSNLPGYIGKATPDEVEKHNRIVKADRFKLKKDD